MRVVDADVIDNINILQASFSLCAKQFGIVCISRFSFVDGLHRIPIITPQKPLVKGDSLSVSIAAASIIAKVTRDRIMEMYHRQFPNIISVKIRDMEQKNILTPSDNLVSVKFIANLFMLKT